MKTIKEILDPCIEEDWVDNPEGGTMPKRMLSEYDSVEAMKEYAVMIIDEFVVRYDLKNTPISTADLEQFKDKLKNTLYYNKV